MPLIIALEILAASTTLVHAAFRRERGVIIEYLLELLLSRQSVASRADSALRGAILRSRVQRPDSLALPASSIAIVCCVVVLLGQGHSGAR